MLVNTWLGTIMFAWGKIVELQQKQLDRHTAQREPLMVSAEH